jgi:hypothetical protein
MVAIVDVLVRRWAAGPPPFAILQFGLQNNHPIERAVPVTRHGHASPSRPGFSKKAFPLGGAAPFPEIGRPLASHFQLPCPSKQKR